MSDHIQDGTVEVSKIIGRVPKYKAADGTHYAFVPIAQISKEHPAMTAMRQRAIENAGPRDFTEDFSHENGNYYCHCANCKQDFKGHKRRVFCKVCENKAIEPEETR